MDFEGVVDRGRPNQMVCKIRFDQTSKMECEVENA
jgi:hypothetical protein